MKKNTRKDMQNNIKRFTPLLSALLIGGLIGVGATLLAAPRSGKETRAMLRDRSAAVKDRALSAADDTRERAAKAVTSIASTTKESASALRSRSMHLLDRGKEQIEDTKKEIARN